MILAKGVGANITDQQRHVFSQALGLGVGQQIMAFSGKADAKQLPADRWIRLSQRCQNVLVFNKGQLRRLTRAVLFDFLRPLC